MKIRNYHRIKNYREDYFKKQQKNDNLKKEYCQKNNIPLYIINYKQDIITEMEKIIDEI